MSHRTPPPAVPPGSRSRTDPIYDRPLPSSMNAMNASKEDPSEEANQRVHAFSSLRSDEKDAMLAQMEESDFFVGIQSSLPNVAAQEAPKSPSGSGSGKDLASQSTSLDDSKRKVSWVDEASGEAKKQCVDFIAKELVITDADDGRASVPVGYEGFAFCNDADVLCGRGGGTNVHAGNRYFRELANIHRRAYLQAHKNDRPDISRAIVRAVRDTGGRFLKRQEKSGLWFEIGDNSAREKAAQALRQRATEMRKILFESGQFQEQVKKKVGGQEQLLQESMASLVPAMSNAAFNPMMAAPGIPIMMNPLYAVNKVNFPPPLAGDKLMHPNDNYAQMSLNYMNAVLLEGETMNGFPPKGP